MKIFVYVGHGASFSEDVISALNKLKVRPYRIDENGISKGNLKKDSILIVPGGWPQKYVRGLGKKGLAKIRSFVRSGGCYVGICAGSYLALNGFDIGKKYKGLELVNSYAQHRKLAPGKMRTLKIIDTKNPIIKGYPKTSKIFYLNGPTFKPDKNTDVIATFGNGTVAISTANYGKGKVILFSPHPEGNLEYKKDPVKLGTIKLIENMLSYIQR